MNISKVQNTNFKGLGVTTIYEYNNGWATTGYDETTTTIHYYPFKGETKEQIDAFVKENTDYETIEYYKNPSSAPPLVTLGTDRINNVKVEKELPFSEQEYDNHEKISSLTAKEALKMPKEKSDDFLKVQDAIEALDLKYYKKY